MNRTLITVHEVPKGPNARGGLFRMHWAARRKYFDKWSWLIRIEAGAAHLCAGEMKSIVNIHQVRKRSLDTDNLYASCKPILDSLRKLGLIFDDNPKWCELKVTQEIGKSTRTL
jgi:hypothetical protein